MSRPGPVGGKRHENRLQRAQTLRVAALGLFLERGIESVAIDDIVERANVAKGSFYRYYTDKRALVSEIMAPLYSKLTEALEHCERALGAAKDDAELHGAYLQMATELAGVLFENLEVVRLYIQESRAPSVAARVPVCELAEHLADWAYKLTVVAEDRGLLRAVNARVTGVSVLGAIERLLFESLRGSPPAEPLAVAEALISMVLEGLRPRSRSRSYRSRPKT